MLVSNSLRSACRCLPSAAVKVMGHHRPAKRQLLEKEKLGLGFTHVNRSLGSFSSQSIKGNLNDTQRFLDSKSILGKEYISLQQEKFRTSHRNMKMELLNTMKASQHFFLWKSPIPYTTLSSLPWQPEHDTGLPDLNKSLLSLC